MDNGSVISRFDCGHGGMKMDPDASGAHSHRTTLAREGVVPLGRIAKFFEDGGYGFIKPDAGGPDLFFHTKGIVRLGWGTIPRVEARVEFDIVTDRVNGRIRAENVRLLSGRGRRRRGAQGSVSAVTGQPRPERKYRTCAVTWARQTSAKWC
jgi:cold shock CspA family protein